MALLELNRPTATATRRLPDLFSVLVRRVFMARKTPEEYAAAEALRTEARATVDRLLL